MKVLDLFSGIGGFSLGLTRAGMRTTAFCEIEEYPRSILRKHWPDVPIFNDVKELHATDLPEAVDLICGGYPCQPFSVAGKREGKDDDRHLWPEIIRLVRELDNTTGKPDWCIFENVAGHVSMGLDKVLSDLESEGYSCRTFIIPACAVNAPHRRDRVWIIANSSGAGCEERNIAAIADKQGYRAGCSNADDAANAEMLRWDEKQAPDTLKKNSELSWPAGRSDREGVKHPWISQSPVCSRNDGISDRVARLKALGNAVVPQIPELIGRAIMEASSI